MSSPSSPHSPNAISATSVRTATEKGRCNKIVYKVRHQFARLHFLSVIQGVMTVLPFSMASLLLKYVTLFSFIGFACTQVAMLSISMVAFHVNLCLAIVFAKVTFFVAAAEFSVGTYAYVCPNNCSFMEHIVSQKNRDAYDIVTVASFIYGLLHLITAIAYIVNATRRCRRDCEDYVSSPGTPAQEIYIRYPPPNLARSPQNVRKAHDGSHSSQGPKHDSTGSYSHKNGVPSSSSSSARTAGSGHHKGAMGSVPEQKEASTENSAKSKAPMEAAKTANLGATKEVLITRDDLDIDLGVPRSDSFWGVGGRRPASICVSGVVSDNDRTDAELQPHSKHPSNVNVFEMHPLPSVFEGYEGGGGDNQGFIVIAGDKGNVNSSGTMKSSRSVFTDDDSGSVY